MAGQQHIPLVVGDITHFLKEHRETKIRSTVLGSSDFQLEQLQETHVMSITSGETRHSSIFDPVESSSSVSSALPGRRLPCEFYWHGDCEETFDLRDIDGWVDHVVAHHLDMILPSKSCCWFCDEVVFHAQPETQQQCRLSYTDRMHHIADHFRRGATLAGVRPDFDFLDHLHMNELISEGSFQRARNFHEAPQPKNGIKSVQTVARVDRGAVIEVRSRPLRRPRGRPESHTSYRS
ncbi:hypothetical protein N5P37_010877 [Trichoderma harzianum]|uniref:Uncharacterized protein n=1 Tax=Trichoderma harzianum CBS 226.95 TaxID=983964 RepID=A0A2T3ZZ18_TRIHA|nr:hypothetical protein M431DRAFT_96136 [Trichoderma harzianum CBS 226.95]KAK0756721.1 hypothetical protein N5P37_010877 [Trichoderma harzianum]PKK51965.1 hypothetical protein CI102_2258 [Trichoderma harzianum]PTB50061.1 hypothetical protein M431DRAFT_96136 [Trichoderma harzianum CBS 226.95]